MPMVMWLVLRIPSPVQTFWSLGIQTKIEKIHFCSDNLPAAARLLKFFEVSLFIMAKQTDFSLGLQFIL